VTKLDDIRTLESAGASFIVNVIVTGTRKPARTLRTLATLVRRGRSLATASFAMPYERILVDGANVDWATLQAGPDAVEARVAAAWAE
jgi:hypothetical protein